MTNDLLHAAAAFMGLAVHLVAACAARAPVDGLARVALALQRPATVAVTASRLSRLAHSSTLAGAPLPEFDVGAARAVWLMH